jgi:hypothetical protein
VASLSTMALMILPAGTARSAALRKPMNSSLALHAAADYDAFQHTFSTANSVGRRIGMRATASGCAFAGRDNATRTTIHRAPICC